MIKKYLGKFEGIAQHNTEEVTVIFSDAEIESIDVEWACALINLASDDATYEMVDDGNNVWVQPVK
jgi:hypothetical protein